MIFDSMEPPDPFWATEKARELAEHDIDIGAIPKVLMNVKFVAANALTAEQVWERMREMCPMRLAFEQGSVCAHPAQARKNVGHTPCAFSTCPLLKEAR